MRAAYETHKTHGFEVLSVSVGETDAAIEGFVTKHGLDYRFLMDRTGDISTTYEVTTTPTTYFIAPDGTIADSLTGVVTRDWLDDHIANYVAT